MNQTFSISIMANSILAISFLVFIVSKPKISITKTENLNQKQITTKLIHRDNIHKPQTDRHDTLQDRVEHFMEASTARVIYLQATIEKQNKNKNNVSNFKADVRTHTSPFMLFVNFSIGDPPIPQLTIMDTGSTLLWLQCLPCKRCFKQTMSIFDPSDSATYSPLPCKSETCAAASNAQCNALRDCAYNQQYLKGCNSEGILATEQITFHNSDDEKIVAPDVVFGCGHDNYNQVDESQQTEFAGIMGLGYKQPSLAIQLGSKFSYCIGNINDPDYTYNRLALGIIDDIEGDSTPIEKTNGFYYVTLEGITVGGKPLDIDPSVFKRSVARTGVVFDSGSTLTWLAEDGYRKLHNEVRRLLDENSLMRFWYKNYLCYQGTISRELVGFPVVAFRFAGEAVLALDARSLFRQFSTSPEYHDIFCMAVRLTSEHGNDYRNFSIIGLMAQQDYNIGYDLDGSELFLQRTDCALLDDDYSD